MIGEEYYFYPGPGSGPTTHITGCNLSNGKTRRDKYDWSIEPFFFLLNHFQGVVASYDNSVSAIVVVEKSMAAATFITSIS